MRKQPLILVPTQSRNRRVAAVVTAVILSIAGAASAKLPAPPGQDPAKAAADAEKAKAQLAEEQAALTRAQDRTADYYRREMVRQGKTPPAPTPVEPTSQANLPKTVKEPPGGTAPQGGTRPSAEAHSGNAK